MRCVCSPEPVTLVSWAQMESLMPSPQDSAASQCRHADHRRRKLFRRNGGGWQGRDRNDGLVTVGDSANEREIAHGRHQHHHQQSDDG